MTLLVSSLAPSLLIFLGNSVKCFHMLLNTQGVCIFKVVFFFFFLLCAVTCVFCFLPAWNYKKRFEWSKIVHTCINDFQFAASVLANVVLQSARILLPVFSQSQNHTFFIYYPQIERFFFRQIHLNVLLLNQNNVVSLRECRNSLRWTLFFVP